MAVAGRRRASIRNSRDFFVPYTVLLLILISVLVLIVCALIPPSTRFSGGVMRLAPSADVSPSGLAVFRLTATAHFHDAVDRKGMQLLCLWTRKASSGVAVNGRLLGPVYCHSTTILEPVAR
jgi:hypothetical protein